jgi:ketopantoate reductase
MTAEPLLHLNLLIEDTKVDHSIESDITYMLWLKILSHIYIPPVIGITAVALQRLYLAKR